MAIALPRDWRKILEQWHKSERVCIRCGTKYKLSNNLGNWNCFQHITIGERPSPSERWPCCGMYVSETKRITTCGCIPCDHSAEDKILDPADTAELVPKNIARELNVSDKAIVIPQEVIINGRKVSIEDIPRGAVKVLRCDPVKFNLQLSNYHNEMLKRDK